MSNDLIMSPSLYKEWKKCPRKALINSNRFLGNIHTVYGRSYEYGARLMIEYMQDYSLNKGLIFDKVNDIQDAMERERKASQLIIGYSFLESSKYITKFSLDQHREKNVYTLSTGLNNTYAYLKLFLINNTVEEYEERLIFKNHDFTIGGAYDLRATDALSGNSSLYDFKGITSLWNYSFPSSPQLPIYTVLKQMAYLASGSNKVMSINGGYLINMTSAKKEGEPFIYIPVNTKLVIPNLLSMMSDFIISARELHKLYSKNTILISQYNNAPVGLDECTVNYNCFQLTECENSNFSLVTHPDDRVFDNKQVMTYSDSLLKSAIKIIQKNSSTTNLAEGDGILRASEFAQEDILKFYDADTLKLNEL